MKSWTSTSWIGISFKKKGFKQRGFPLTILFFLSHFPSQAKWQLQLKELASKLLKGNKSWCHYTWTYRSTEITKQRWGALSCVLFLWDPSSILQIWEVLCRFYIRAGIVIKIYTVMHMQTYVYKPKCLKLLFKNTYITTRAGFIMEFNPSYSSPPSLNWPHKLHPRVHDLQHDQVPAPALSCPPFASVPAQTRARREPLARWIWGSYWNSKDSPIYVHT